MSTTNSETAKQPVMAEGEVLENPSCETEQPAVALPVVTAVAEPTVMQTSQFPQMEATTEKGVLEKPSDGTEPDVVTVPVATQPIGQPLLAVAVQQPVMMTTTQQTPSSSSIVNWGPFPLRVSCGHCNSDVTTACEYKTVLATHAACCVLCVIGCWPCACIPYCSNSCKGVVHSCPSCRQQLGMHNPMD